MTDTVDIGGYSQAKSAANAVKKNISEVAEQVYGQDADLEITLRDEGDQYVLYWDAGPYAWPIKLTGEEDPLYNITGFAQDNDEIYVECKNMVALTFGNY